MHRRSRKTCASDPNYIGGSPVHDHQSGCDALQVHIGTGASQSIPVSPPMGAPGGAASVGTILATSAGRSKKRLMSDASSVFCATSDSPVDPAVLNRAAS